MLPHTRARWRSIATDPRSERDQTCPPETRHFLTRLRTQMEAAGLRTGYPIVADGTLHRFHVEGDTRGTCNGWYVAFLDDPPTGVFGCWRRGVKGRWSSRPERRMDQAELQRFRRRMAEAGAARLQEESRRHEEAQSRARGMWGRAESADPNHPYLRRKQVVAGAARQQGGFLVLPVVDLDGRLWSLQFIDSTGGKRLLRGGRKRGNVIHVAGAMPQASRIFVCEGWATGQTLVRAEATALVLAAIDAGNLKLVALAVRQRWPDAEIVICCDADDVGITKGRAAAIAAGANVAIPSFPAGVEGSDFNDLANAGRAVTP